MPTGYKDEIPIWLMRSKHGRNTIFSTPETMWGAACEYFKAVDDNPWYRSEVIKSGENAGQLFAVPVKQPYTIEGLCTFWKTHNQYFYEFERNAKEKHKEFLDIIAEIRNIIYNQKFSGAASGFFNAQFIGKALGLIDRQLVGQDPDNPMPSPITFYIPDNGRGGNIKQIKSGEVPFSLE